MDKVESGKNYKNIIEKREIEKKIDYLKIPPLKGRFEAQPDVVPDNGQQITSTKVVNYSL